jgi:hypothetical protein
MSNTRQYTEILLTMIEDGILDKDNVIRSLVNYMSEDDVKDMVIREEFISYDD